jgi:hypothetical protein
MDIHDIPIEIISYILSYLPITSLRRVSKLFNEATLLGEKERIDILIQRRGKNETSIHMVVRDGEWDNMRLMLSHKDIFPIRSIYRIIEDAVEKAPISLLLLLLKEYPGSHEDIMVYMDIAIYSERYDTTDAIYNEYKPDVYQWLAGAYEDTLSQMREGTEILDEELADLRRAVPYMERGYVDPGKLVMLACSNEITPLIIACMKAGVRNYDEMKSVSSDNTQYWIGFASSLLD